MRSSILGLAAIATFSAAPSQAANLNLADIAVKYVQAQQDVMERSAGAREIDALLAFYTDDYAYYHPQYGAKVTGRDAQRQGIQSHLGETAVATIEVKGMLMSGDIVTLSTETRFTVVSDGRSVVRTGVWVLTFRGNKIAQRVDVTSLPLKPVT